MYLAPHHFQAQNRYFENSIHFATENLWNECYGFAAVQTDVDALRNGTVVILHARGLFEDGLAFDMPESDPLPAPRNIANAFSPTADHLTIQLAIRRWSAEVKIANLRPAPKRNPLCGRKPRTQGRETGRYEKPVQWDGRTSNWWSATKKRRVPESSSRPCNQGQLRQFRLRPSLHPAMFEDQRQRAIVWNAPAVGGNSGEKSTAVSHDQHLEGGKFKVGLSARHIAQFWFLHAVNSSLSPLRHLLLSKHGTPRGTLS